MQRRIRRLSYDIKNRLASMLEYKINLDTCITILVFIGARRCLPLYRVRVEIKFCSRISIISNYAKTLNPDALS